MPTQRSRLWTAIAVAVGALPAVLIFNLTFADSAGPLAVSLLLRLLMGFGIFGLIGAAFGYFRPSRSWEWGLEIGVVAMILLGFPGLMALRNGAVSGFAVAFGALAAVLVGGCLGGWLGARLAQSRRSAVGAA